jgi:hypothetical protein
MARGALLSDEQIGDLTAQLRHRTRFARRAAVEILTNVDFDQFERPVRLSLLLAALDTPELQDLARGALTRVLRGMDDAELAALLPDERRSLRQSLASAFPHRHAEFIIGVVRALVHSCDLEAIPELASLMEKSAISRRVVRRFAHGWGYTDSIVASFEGTREEESEMWRVHTAAHVAYERLAALAERLETKGDLLVPAAEPRDDTLLRPGAATSSEDAYLLRPADGETDTR